MIKFIIIKGQLIEHRKYVSACVCVCHFGLFCMRYWTPAKSRLNTLLYVVSLISLFSKRIEKEPIVIKYGVCALISCLLSDLCYGSGIFFLQWIFTQSCAYFYFCLCEISVPGEGTVYIYEESLSKQQANSSYRARSTHNANIRHIDGEMLGGMKENSTSTMLLDIRQCHTLWLIVLSTIFWHHIWRTRICHLLSLKLFPWKCLPVVVFIEMACRCHISYMLSSIQRIQPAESINISSNMIDNK